MRSVSIILRRTGWLSNLRGNFIICPPVLNIDNGSA
jgi:hypothetical protein